LAPTHSCPFIVQGQPLQVVLFFILHVSLLYHILPTPEISSIIPRIPIIDTKSKFLLLKQWPEMVSWVRTSCTTWLPIQGVATFHIFSEAILIHTAAFHISREIPHPTSSNIHKKHG